MVKQLELGSRLRVVWDDGVISGGQHETEVDGVVIEWLPSRPPGGAPSARVMLDEPITATGVVSDKSGGALTGRVLLLRTRYQGQDWSDRENTVHVFLEASDPSHEVAPNAWITSHGVWLWPDSDQRAHPTEHDGS